jgi:hypothetical protein
MPRSRRRVGKELRRPGKETCKKPSLDGHYARPSRQFGLSYGTVLGRLLDAIGYERGKDPGVIPLPPSIMGSIPIARSITPDESITRSSSSECSLHFPSFSNCALPGSV